MCNKIWSIRNVKLFCNLTKHLKKKTACFFFLVLVYFVTRELIRKKEQCSNLGRFEAWVASGSALGVGDAEECFSLFNFPFFGLAVMVLLHRIKEGLVGVFFSFARRVRDYNKTDM